MPKKKKNRGGGKQEEDENTRIAIVNADKVRGRVRPRCATSLLAQARISAQCLPPCVHTCSSMRCDPFLV